MEDANTESNEDYGMLFRLSQEGSITYTDLIQQVSVSPKAIVSDAQGLPPHQPPCGSFMQLLQAPIESESNLYLTSNRFEYDHTFWNVDPLNEYQHNDMQNIQRHTPQICNSLPHSVGVNPPLASLDILSDEMQKTSNDVDVRAEMCSSLADVNVQSIVQLNATSTELLYDEMQRQIVETDDCFDQHIEHVSEEDLLSDHATVANQQDEGVEQAENTENPDQNFSKEDINIFLENESVATVQRGGHEADNARVPAINKVFATEQEALDFYNDYAYVVGFSSCKASNYHSRRTDAVTRHTLKCNRWRKPSDPKQTDQAEVDELEHCLQANTAKPLVKNRKQNKVVYTKCQAEMVITLKKGFWYVTRLNLEHNHPLSPPEETKFLRSHKHMTDQEKALIRTLNTINVGLSTTTQHRVSDALFDICCLFKLFFAPL